MATIAIAVAAAGATGGLSGGALFAASAGFAAAGIGASFVDQRFLLPALFPARGVRPGNLPEVNFRSGAEGRPIIRFYGPECRVTTQLIWTSRVRDLSRTAGGKGGRPPNVPAVERFLDAAYALGVPGGGKALSLEKIIGEGKTFYDRESDAFVTSSTIAIEPDFRSGLEGRQRGLVVIEETTLPATEQFNSEIRTNGWFRGGRFVQITGASNSENNRSFQIERVRGNQLRLQFRGKFDPSQDPDDPSFIPIVEESTGATITVTQLAGDRNSPPLTGGVQFFDGGPGQQPSTVIENEEGSLSVEANVGLSYVVLEDIPIERFGGRPPLQVDAIVAERAAVTTGDIIREELVGVYKLHEDEIDVSLCTQNVRGYIIEGVKSAEDALSPLLTAYKITIQERDGKLHFVPKDQREVIEVTDENDWTVREFGSTPGRPKIADDVEQRLPNEARVRFLDVDSDLQIITETEDLDGTEGSVAPLDLPIALARNEAREIVKDALSDAYGASRRLNLPLPFKYAHVAENDELQVPFEGNLWKALVERVRVGQNGLVLVEGRIIDADQIDEPFDPEPLGRTRGLLPSPVMIDVIDLAPLRDADTDQPGFYLVVSTADFQEPFQGAAIYSSKNPVLPFRRVAEVFDGATMGRVVSGATLGDGPVGYWDRKNTIDVEIEQGELGSLPALDVLEGDNVCAIGNEILSFQDALLVGTKTYRLSKLLRGLRGTWQAVPTHGENERFVLLDSRVRFVPLNEDRSMGDLFLKAVGSGQLESEILQEKFLLTMAQLSRFPPVAVRSEVLDTSPIVVRFEWRLATRRFQRVWQQPSGAVRLDDEGQTDLVRIYRSAGGLGPPWSFISEVAVGVAGQSFRFFQFSSATYTSFVSGDGLRVEIYQIAERGNKTNVGTAFSRPAVVEQVLP